MPRRSAASSEFNIRRIESFGRLLGPRLASSRVVHSWFETGGPGHFASNILHPGRKREKEREREVYSSVAYSRQTSTLSFRTSTVDEWFKYKKKNSIATPTNGQKLRILPREGSRDPSFITFLDYYARCIWTKNSSHGINRMQIKTIIWSSTDFEQYF